MVTQRKDRQEGPKTREWAANGCGLVAGAGKHSIQAPGRSRSGIPEPSLACNGDGAPVEDAIRVMSEIGWGRVRMTRGHLEGSQQ